MERHFEFHAILIFYHNSSGGVRFANFEKAMRNDEPNLYSALYKIAPKYKINGKYEFILDYENGFLQWRQNNNPLLETEKGTATVEGYEYIKSTVGEIGSFGGLARTNSSTKFQVNGCISTLLNGIPIDYNWWYSVGTIHSCEARWNGDYIPGSTSISTKYVKLWIRVDGNSVSTCHQRSFSIFPVSPNLIFCIFLLMYL
jgi:hypothetical protein